VTRVDMAVVGAETAAAVWADLAELRRPAPTRVEAPGPGSWLAVASAAGRVLGYAHARRACPARVRRFADVGPDRLGDWLTGALEVLDLVAPGGGTVPEALLRGVAPLAPGGRLWAGPAPHETASRRVYRSLGWVEVVEGLLLAPSHPATRGPLPRRPTVPARWAPWGPTATVRRLPSLEAVEIL
jgi:hypothetical protein